MKTKLIFCALTSLALCISACKRDESEVGMMSINQLAESFVEPPVEYRPYVWWHWMGSNFSKEGITKDLEAMKEAGIGGATIFNLTSAVMESAFPMENNPWPEQTYRSEAYWEALEHAAAEAQRLGLKIGLHNSPGYSTTGGDWVGEERAMKKVVVSKTEVKGGVLIDLQLEKPVLPTHRIWTLPARTASMYWDIEVMAVPKMSEPDPSKVICITDKMDKDGHLTWDAPEGEWTICRIGYAPTMSSPHPVPDELVGETLEVDKLSLEHNTYHWDMVLTPIVEHLKPYIGKSFTHILVDSYEAGYQDWTDGFCDKFKELKGYDPMPWLAMQQTFEADKLKQFKKDNSEVVNRMLIDNGWKVAKEKINAAGLEFCIEPYDFMDHMFNTYEGASLADVPMVEFWNTSHGGVQDDVVRAAKDFSKRIVGVEAFTGRPEVSMYTEDPAMLKHSADGAMHNGVNRFYLHHWVHQPFSDDYQPGMGMGWWGTHFSRHQTWIKPGQAFFYYLGRCQMLLQHGRLNEIYDNVLHRQLDDAEVFFVHNPSKESLNKRFEFKATSATPQLWDAEEGIIRKIHSFEVSAQGTTVDITLNPDQSVFVVFPHKCDYENLVQPNYELRGERGEVVKGPWSVTFQPKLDKAFEMTFDELVDFSHSDAPQVKYFAGTATYRKSVNIDVASLQSDKKILLDLGQMNDIAEVWVNGKHAGVAWYPPFVVDITSCLKSGENQVEIAVSNNWANRLIGDEQHPADFEWGLDRGEELGRAMKSFPDWFVNNQPRPSSGRKTFNIWYYYRPHSALVPAGLVGPVKIVEQDIVVHN